VSRAGVAASECEYDDTRASDSSRKRGVTEEEDKEEEKADACMQVSMH
jgi:hypothetical protein